MFHDIRFMQGFHEKNRHHQPLVLPQNKLIKNTCNANRPIGISYEFKRLDSNLNKDLHEGVNRLYSITSCLDDLNPVKFSKIGLKQMLSAHAQAWDTFLLPKGYPSAQRIQQDIDRVVDEVYLTIFHAWGIVMPGLGTRCGQRYERSIVQLPCGGKMKKKNFKKNGFTQMH